MKKLYFTTMIAVFMLLFTIGLQAQNTQTKQREQGAVVFDFPRMEDVIIKKDIPYCDISGTTLKMDVYYPPDFDFLRNIPAVILVLGYPDMAGKKLLGSEFKNYIQFVSWSNLTK